LKDSSLQLQFSNHARKQWAEGVRLLDEPTAAYGAEIQKGIAELDVDKPFDRLKKYSADCENVRKG